MMDALINAFVDEIKQKSTGYAEETDRPLYDTSTDSDGILDLFSYLEYIFVENRRNLVKLIYKDPCLFYTQLPE